MTFQSSMDLQTIFLHIPLVEVSKEVTAIHEIKLEFLQIHFPTLWTEFFPRLLQQNGCTNWRPTCSRVVISGSLAWVRCFQEGRVGRFLKFLKSWNYIRINVQNFLIWGSTPQVPGAYMIDGDGIHANKDLVVAVGGFQTHLNMGTGILTMSFA